MTAPELDLHRPRVDPEWIKEQRKLGWPDMHPEDYCHRCGVKIPMWCTDRDTWLAATSEWAAETGKEGICCFDCLTDMMPGKPPIWWIVPLSWLTRHDAEVKEAAVRELADLFGQPRVLWYGDRSVQVATDPDDPNSHVPICDWLRARADQIGSDS